jgi:hypothetical protein
MPHLILRGLWLGTSMICVYSYSLPAVKYLAFISGHLYLSVDITLKPNSQKGKAEVAPMLNY